VKGSHALFAIPGRFDLIRRPSGYIAALGRLRLIALRLAQPNHLSPFTSHRFSPANVSWPMRVNLATCRIPA
jgi:hypothetical protein